MHIETIKGFELLIPKIPNSLKNLNFVKDNSSEQDFNYNLLVVTKYYARKNPITGKKKEPRMCYLQCPSLA